MKRELYNRAWMLCKMTWVKIDELKKTRHFRQPMEAPKYEEAVGFLEEVAEILYRMLE